MPIQIQSNIDLQSFHTFGIHQSCQHLVTVSNVSDVQSLYSRQDMTGLPKLLVGKGSNMLFTEPYEGVVVINQMLGKAVEQTETHWQLHIEAGEDWPALVQWATKNGYYGLENLALIPGCAGSAPIQNIGAYGVELKDVCRYVDVICLESFEIKRLSNQECQFGYRDSIFKHELYEKVMVIAIGIELPKKWVPNIGYGPLQDFDLETVTASQIFERVCHVRQQKLPDPKQTGNAGSFFKNPLVSIEKYEYLKQAFPDLVAYPSLDRSGQDVMKLAAGWLIDQCGLKGEKWGGAQVHPNQALVIVNTDKATADDVVNLAAKVRGAVLERYGVELEHEVRFMGSKCETNLNEILVKRSLV